MTPGNLPKSRPFTSANDCTTGQMIRIFRSPGTFPRKRPVSLVEPHLVGNGKRELILDARYFNGQSVDHPWFVLEFHRCLE